MITAVNAVVSIRKAGTAADETAPDLEPEEGDPEGAVPGAVPVPPAAVDNSANPTDAGEERYTVYTFFRNESPTIQSGLPSVGAMLEFWLRSKKAPRHVVGSLLSN